MVVLLSNEHITLTFPVSPPELGTLLLNAITDFS